MHRRTTTMTSHSEYRKDKPAPKKRAIPSDIRERCLSSFQKKRRMESTNFDGYCRCISCGRVMHWKEAQGGHYIPRGCRATELEPDNVWAQCPICNGPKHGNVEKYRERLIERIGIKRVERIENMADAYYGSDEAMQKLELIDQMKVIQNRSKKYYLDKKKIFDADIKKLMEEL